MGHAGSMIISIVEVVGIHGSEPLRVFGTLKWLTNGC